MATTVTAGRTREESAERRRKGAALKKEMDVWVAKLGGWDTYGMRTDIAMIAAHFSPEVEVGYLQASLSMLTTQGTVGDIAHEALSKVDVAMAVPDKELQATWVALVRAANGSAEVIEGDTWPFDMRLLPVPQLFADDRYQRPEHSPFIRELLLKFEERLVGAIDVAQRSSKRFAVLDGQQRVAVMRQVGKTHCWCAVYEGMSLAEEAAFFYKKNRDRKQMAYYYAFRARLLSGDATAQMIHEILATCGFEAGPVTDWNTVIGAMRAVEDVYELPTDQWPNSLKPSLDLIKVCWLGRPSSLDSTLLRGLGRFMSVYGKREIQWVHFQEALTALGPALVIGRARDFGTLGGGNKSAGGKMGVAVAHTLGEIHNQGLPRGERLDLTRLPKPLKR